MSIEQRLQSIINTTPRDQLADHIMRAFWLDAVHENALAAIQAIDEHERDVARYWCERIDGYLTGKHGTALPERIK